MREKPVHLCVIGAHIGDAEIMAGGVVCKYVESGHKATLVHLTPGEKGNPRLSPAQYRKQKVSEARKFASAVGAEVIVLNYKDGELPDNEEVRLRVCDIIRKIKPDIVITHWKGSFHKDHRTCHNVVMDGVFYAALPGIKRALPAHSIKLLYYAENWEDPYDYQPDIWIDISSVYNKWLEALKVEALFRGEISSFDYMRYYQGLVNLRGAEVGFAQAETFMLPPISRKVGAEWFPLDKPVLIF